MSTKCLRFFPSISIYQIVGTFLHPVTIHNDSKQKIAENFVEISQQPKFSYLMEKFTTDYQT